MTRKYETPIRQFSMTSWFLLAFTVMLFAPTPLWAGGAVNTGYFGGVAIKGYDPVAYFTMSRAVEGSPDLTHEWLGETWHFENDKHRQVFISDPIRYAPQFGGYCAAEMLYADVTTGITSNIDPEAWKIVDGKLYLFYDKGYAEHFAKNAGKLVPKAGKNWQKVKNRLVTN